MNKFVDLIRHHTKKAGAKVRISGQTAKFLSGLFSEKTGCELLLVAENHLESLFHDVTFFVENGEILTHVP